MPYRCERKQNGCVVTVKVSDFAVPRCSNCGEIVFDYSADEQIRAALQAQFGPAMNWQEDAATAQAAVNHPLPLQARMPAQQYPGRTFIPASWNDCVAGFPRWPRVQPLLSSPQNIINLFQQGAFLEALAMVVSWGRMWRQPQSIYGHRSLPVIQQALERCAESIRQTSSIRDAWDVLTGELAWSAVLASKTLSFLSRALGFVQQPPVAIDGAVIRDLVWPAFISNIPAGQRPRDWEGDTFDAYSRYMTAILVWARQRQWTTTELEATLFHEYRPNRAGRTRRSSRGVRRNRIPAAAAPLAAEPPCAKESNRFGVGGAAGYVVGHLDETPRTEEELIRLAQEMSPEGLVGTRYATDATVECPAVRRLAREGRIIRQMGRDGRWRYCLGKEWG
jgi:hypothetical protein